MGYITNTKSTVDLLNWAIEITIFYRLQIYGKSQCSGIGNNSLFIGGISGVE